MADDATMVEQLRMELRSVRADLEQRDRALAEALEQQTATADDLRIIASSPSALDRVFDALAERAVQLCDGAGGVAYRVDGDVLRIVAFVGDARGSGIAVGTTRPITPQHRAGRAVLEGRIVHVEDIGSEQSLLEFPENPLRQTVVHGGSHHGATVVVPMLRHGVAIGAITVSRNEPRRFSDQHIALLETFANEAVIAIENARLFEELADKNRELTESLEQQTASADVLRIIASSPTNVSPVLDALVVSAVRLCEADHANINGLEGEELVYLAATNPDRMGTRQRVAGTVSGHALRERRTIHVWGSRDEQIALYPESPGARNGVGVQLSTPLLREGEPIGILGVVRIENRPFTDQQIRLLETFADQAVIAIENARLFDELEQRNRELQESNRQVTAALEQQTVTAEVLRVIASSPTDLQHVLDVIAESTVRLCGAESVVIRVVEGTNLRRVALAGPAPARGLRIDELVPMSHGTVVGRSIMQRATIHIPDVQASLDVPLDEYTTSMEGARLATPLLREGTPFGGILLLKRAAGPFTERQVALVESFADQAVIAIENARLFEELEQRNAELQESNRQVSEALERQTATSEILRAIADAPADLSGVFDILARNAARVCGAEDTVIHLVEDGQMRIMAHHGPVKAVLAPGGRLPIRRTSVAGRSILDRQTIHILDLAAVSPDDLPESIDRARQTGQRTTLVTPMLRQGEAIGLIMIRRLHVEAFTDAQVAALEAFAAQAVIAIENARLFEELEQRNAELQESNRRVSDALEQQTATSEILRTIAGSPNDLDAVFETVARNAARVCGADDAVIHRVVNGHNHVVAHHGPIRSSADARELRPISRDGVVGLVILDRQTIHILDAAAVSEDELPMLLHRHRQSGQRTTLATPMLLQGEAIGSIMIRRLHVEAFTENQIAALEAFADQAVIAIENARLFEELEQRNAELQESNRRVSEALEQQTVTAEVLRVIASSPTDKTKVLEAISSAAARLTESDGACVLQLVGDRLQSVAAYGSEAAAMDRWRASTQGTGDSTARPLTARTVVATAFRERRTIHVPDMDIAVENEYPDARDHHRAMGHRSQVVTPLLREGEPIGVLVVQNYSSRQFTEQQVALVESFANQAVIAIENTRLFEELQESTARLKRSVDELEALGEVSQAVSSSLDLQEVLTTILTRAVELSMSDGGTVYARDDETGRFRLRASHGMSPALASAFDANDRAGLTSPIVERLLAARAPVSIPSIDEDDRLIERGPDDPVRVVLQREGFKSVLGLPLLRDDRVLGALVIRRKTTGDFPPAVVELLQTFASQSALAIQNARLFQEVEEKSRELEEASQHKSQFLANMSHELRTPLNAVIGYSEMLQEELGDLGQEALVPDVEKINAAGRHLLGLINDILDLSKIEAGKMELFIEPVDVAALVQDVTATVAPLIAKNGNQLRVDVASDSGDMQADATKLRQILFNLLGNAAKFTDHGTITLTVGREVGDWLVFSVADTGIGMTEKQLGRLFQAFMQAEASTTRTFGGTGLGLTLVRHFAEMMGGAVGVSSTAGVGSTFTVRLPAVMTTPEQHARERDLLAADASDGRSPDPGRLNAPVVLVIDDDATSRELLRRHLEADGMRVMEATGGDEGLQLARTLQPSLITLDVLMPGLDGWAVLGALKGDPVTAEIPVILLTILDDRDLGYALGAADYLTKPLDRDRLLRAVSKHVRHGELGAARRALIVEDDPATRDMLRRLLHREGWVVEEAANGRIGLELVAAAPPDLILLDLMMPELDGFGFVERLRAEPDWRTIPVLVITAKDLTAQERLRLNGWVEQVLQKGAYSRSELLAEVRALVRTSVEQP